MLGKNISDKQSGFAKGQAIGPVIVGPEKTLEVAYSRRLISARDKNMEEEQGLLKLSVLGTENFDRVVIPTG